MKPLRLFGFLLTLLILQGVAVDARAACTDPPAPGVDWSRCSFDGLDLTKLDMTDANIRDSSFIRSDLAESDLSGIEGYRAKFVSAKMHDVVFDKANLFQADFTKADLKGASFRNADLRSARLYRANLRDADLTGARMREADLTRTDFSGATWTDGERVCREGSIGRCF